MGTCLRLRMMSVASSTTPGIEENSWSTPSILTAVTAAPSIELSKARRRALPTVVPHPRSNGCAEKRPYFSVSDSRSDARCFGFWKPFHILFLLSVANLVGHQTLEKCRLPAFGDQKKLENPDATSSTARRSAAR